MERITGNKLTETVREPDKTPEENQGEVKILTNPSKQITEAGGITPNTALTGRSCTVINRTEQEAEACTPFTMEFVNLGFIQGNWEHKFKNYDKKINFYPSNGTSPVKVDFFHTYDTPKLKLFIGEDKNQVPDISHLYHDDPEVIQITDDLQKKIATSNVAVRLPLQNGNVADLIILNDKTTTNVVESLKTIISSLNNSPIEYYVDVYAPKVKFQSKLSSTPHFNKILFDNEHQDIPATTLDKGFESLADTAEISAEQQVIVEMNKNGFNGTEHKKPHKIVHEPQHLVMAQKLDVHFNRPFYIVVSNPNDSNQNIKFFAEVNDPPKSC